jgi:hypothetical protein
MAVLPNSGGFRGWGSLAAAEYNSNLFVILAIASGYTAAGGANGIASGDPVCAGADGTIKLGVPAVAASPWTVGANGVPLGTFINAAWEDAATGDTVSGGWVNGTVPAGGRIGRALVMIDPNVVYALQIDTANSGLSQINAFDNANWSYSPGTFFQSNSISNCGLAQASLAVSTAPSSNLAPLKIWNYESSAAQAVSGVNNSTWGNFLYQAATTGNSWNNVPNPSLLVTYNNHYLRAGTVGGTGA